MLLVKELIIEIRDFLNTSDADVGATAVMKRSWLRAKTQKINLGSSPKTE
jgi:hypothetical protein